MNLVHVLTRSLFWIRSNILQFTPRFPMRMEETVCTCEGFGAETLNKQAWIADEILGVCLLGCCVDTTETPANFYEPTR